jgi:simple sugar transport system permease protein
MTPQGDAPVSVTSNREITWFLTAIRLLLRLVGYSTSFALILAVTFIAFGISPTIALAAILDGAFGNAEHGHLYPISESIVKAVPLLLSGLGVVVAWRAGMFSIGGEGQLLMGALAGTVVGGLAARIPAGLCSGLMLIAGTAAGAFWSWIAAWLRVRRNVQEVISTIMLNYVALYLVETLVLGPLQEASRSGPESDILPDRLLFARLIPPGLANGITPRLHSGALIALLCVPIVWAYLFRTTAGFALRLVGQNPDAARSAGFAVDRVRLQAMAISGGLCGLAGVIELLGVSARLDANFSSGWGYTAIPVALMGGLHPFGTLLSALFFGALTAGSSNAERMVGVPAVIINVIQAAAVLTIVGARAWAARRSGVEAD